MAADALGAILIGGRSTRMGSDKALVEMAGAPMVHWVAAALDRAGLDVVTVGGPDRVPGYENLSDPFGAGGPLAGLAAALDYSGGRTVALVAVDQPLLRPETIGRLLAVPGHDAVVPRAGGHPQVTCALYRPACLPAIDHVVATIPNPSIRHVLRRVDARYVESAEWTEWGEDGRSWRSVDTVADLAAVETAFVEQSHEPGG